MYLKVSRGGEEGREAKSINDVSVSASTKKGTKLPLLKMTLKGIDGRWPTTGTVTFYITLTA